MPPGQRPDNGKAALLGQCFHFPAHWIVVIVEAV
jgi:hypothetical protein